MSAEVDATPEGLDPITLEVVRNAFGSLVDEMALIVSRTAYSATVRDALDFSTAWCDHRAEMIAQGLGIALHLGSFPGAVRRIAQGFRGEINPGDIFILNDPYGWNGIHLPDIYAIKPVFIDDRLEGFSCVVAHHADVGGSVAGSNSTAATEIYQEGLRIPAVKLFSRGVENKAVIDILAANVRVPDQVIGDLRAQLAAVASGERTYRQLAARYGSSVLRQYSTALLDLSERMARAEIRAMPKGTFPFTSFIDNDSVDPDPVAICVSVTIGDDEISVDFDGTSRQVRGGINSPLPFSESAVYAAVRLTMDSDIPSNAGYFRAIRVIAHAGTVVNPVLPGACGARGITGFRIMDAVLGALAPVLADRMPADGEGGNTLVTIGGADSGTPFVYTELISGSRGGSPRGDGPVGVPHPGSNNANMPIEVAESSYPIHFEEYGVVADSGGAGKYRGALALRRRFRYLGHDTIIQIRSDKRRFPPYGLAGGHPGTPSISLLRDGAGERVLPTMGPAQIASGSEFTHELAGGGGWGDPLDRDPALVGDDVRNDRVTLEYARSAYGVVIDPEQGLVDEIATAALRESSRRVAADGR